MKKIIWASIIGLLIFAGCGDPKVRGQKKISDGMQVKKNPYNKTTTHIPYKNGKIHGTMITYWRNGKMKDSIDYVNGKKEGTKKYWSQDGVMVSLKYFKNDEQVGTSKTWDLEGKLSSISSTYTDGRLTGTVKRYHSNGKLWIITHWINGRQNGLEKNYDEQGRLILTKAWVNGQSKGTTLTALEKRNVAALKKEYQNLLADKNKREASSRSTGSFSASLTCSGDSSQPSMSEYNRKIAVARGQGEGAALGSQMKNGSVSTERNQANSYCVQNANASGLACPYAKAYLSGCMSKFGY